MPTKQRRCTNWIQSLGEYVEETESPRHFWLWAALFTITSSLQRKVWLPFGMDELYPNLYVTLVAPPGKCRKGSPLSLAKKLLTDIQITVAVDSQSKRSFTAEMAKIGDTGGYFQYDKKPKRNTAIAVVSKELSSFLALDPKGMIECLTDLYDSHEQWAYKTHGQGQDFLYAPCVNVFAATTPIWIAANLPEEAIGGGFTSRVALIHADHKHKRVTIPPPPDDKIYSDLKFDLAIISNLIGPFEWEAEAFKVFDAWYQGLGTKVRKTRNEKLHSFIERMHIMVLKVAMALRVAYSNDLTLVKSDILGAISTIEDVLAGAGNVFKGHGRSRTALDIAKIMAQINTNKKVTFKQLLSWNMFDITKSELYEILDSIEAGGDIKRIIKEDGETIIWIGD